jgi:uncharacterized protein YbjT (DUF2867 family)
MKTIVLIGGTGLVGSKFLNLCLESSVIESIILLSRTPLPIQHKKITNKIIDFNNLNQTNLNISDCHFVSCLGTTLKDAKSKEEFYKVDYTYNYEFALLAQRSRAKQFILVSAIGADTQSLFYYSNVKGKLEESVKKLKIPSIVIIQPSLILGQRKRNRPIESFMQTMAPKLSNLYIGALKKYHPISATKIAKCILDNLCKPPLGIEILTYEQIGQ